MRKGSQRIACLLGLVSLVCLLASCQRLGFGVVVWPPEGEQWVPGDIVTVKDESRLRNTYIVNQDGNSRLKAEIETWRVGLFSSYSQAEQWADSLGEWVNVYGMVTFQGLPMRTEPSNVSDQVYRFREGERLKILGRQEERVKISRLEGYWYKVMAKGGVRGYVFDHYLNIIEVDNGQETVLNARSQEDPALDNFLSAPWRPEWLMQMVARGQIDLNLFRDEYGLFTDRETRTISLRLPDLDISETWEDIVQLAQNRYEFTGTNLRVTLQGQDSVRLEYNDGTSDKISGFVRPGQSLSFYRQAELDRRDYVTTSLVNTGPSYSSRRYGRLVFFVDGRFRWTGKILLGSREEFAGRLGNTGTVELNMFPDQSISGLYDGVLVLRFDSGSVFRFLYTLDSEGLNLILVPDKAVNGNRVLTDQYIDPLRLEFIPQE